MNKLPATGPYVDRIIRIFRDHPYDDGSAIVLMDYATAAIAASGITEASMATHNDAAAESAARFILAKYEHAPCDSRAVSDCVRCNAVYLAKQAIAAAPQPQGRDDSGERTQCDQYVHDPHNGDRRCRNVAQPGSTWCHRHQEDHEISAKPSSEAREAVTPLTLDVDKNAQRYRWLRDRNNSLERVQQDTGTVNGPSCYHVVGEVRELKWGEELDAAIDAARMARGESHD